MKRFVTLVWVLAFLLVAVCVRAWNIYIDGDGSDWGPHNDVGLIKTGPDTAGVLRAHYHCDGDLLYVSVGSYPPLALGDPLTPTLDLVETGDAETPLSWRPFVEQTGWEAVYNVPESPYPYTMIGTVTLSDGRIGTIEASLYVKCSNLPPRTPCPSCVPVDPTVEAQELIPRSYLPIVTAK